MYKKGQHNKEEGLHVFIDGLKKKISFGPESCNGHPVT